MNLSPEVVYEKGMRLLRKRNDLFGVLLLLSILYAALYLASRLLYGGSELTAFTAVLGGDPAAALTILALIALQPFIMGITVAGVASLREGGMNWKCILTTVGLSLPRVIVASVIYILLVFGALVFSVLMAVGTGSLACLCLALPVMLVLMFYISLRMSLFLQEIILDGAGVVTSLTGSWSKTHGHVKLLLVLHIPVYVVGLLRQIFQPLLLHALLDMQIWNPAYVPALILAGAVEWVNILMFILLESALTVAYMEIRPEWEERMRREKEREYVAYPERIEYRRF